MTRQLIRRTVLNYLVRRDYSQKEILQKLANKGFPLADCEVVVAELVATGSLSDQRFAESFIRYSVAKGLGPRRLNQELKNRGIALQLINESMEGLEAEWIGQIKRIWEKKFKGQKPTNSKEQARQMRFLLYRGFTMEQINQFLKEV